MGETITDILRYCEYQDRCHNEVKQKLWELGEYGDRVEEIMASLIENGVLNETRFAQSFARGKFRMLKWGKDKITYELKQRGISAYNIAKGLQEIDTEEYLNAFKQLGEKKWNEIKTIKSEMEKKRRLNNYFLQKGYEKSLIQQFIVEKMNKDNRRMN